MYGKAFRLANLACMGLLIPLLTGGVGLLSAAPQATHKAGDDVQSFEINAEGMHAIHLASHGFSEITQLYMVGTDNSHDAMKTNALPSNGQHIAQNMKEQQTNWISAQELAEEKVPCYIWNLPADLRTYPLNENPNRDSCGNADVWYFLESEIHPFLDHDPATYSLLQEFITDAFYVEGLQQWQGEVVSLYIKDKLPAIGINSTHSTTDIAGYPWKPGDIRIHPGWNQFAIVGWRSPITGTVEVTGELSNETCQGNGIFWSVDYFDGLSNTSLASSFMPNCSTSSLQDGNGGTNLSRIVVNEGDYLYLVVDPYLGDAAHDSMELMLSIRSRVQFLPFVLRQTATIE